MSTKKSSSYKQIFKATSIFGGVQFMTIVVNIVRSKIIAILLGPSGIGITGLFTSTVNLITAVIGLGVERSSVKNIAEVNASENRKQVSRLAKMLVVISLITGIIGALSLLIFPGFFSKITFGKETYILEFRFLAIYLILMQLKVAYGAVLRGVRHVAFIARSTLFGTVLGLILSAPLFYIFGVNGIVPAMILNVSALFLGNYIYYKKIKLPSVKINKEIFQKEGKQILTLGLVLSISSFIVLAESFIVRVYIRKFGSIDDVGFYNAGFAIVNTYFGVFFVAITTDYYPKLASIVHNKTESIKLMNNQSEMSVLILAPVLCLFLILIKLITVILYSKEFLPIIDMVLWAGLGIYFKSASYALGVLFISKGDKKVIFWNELTLNLLLLGLNVLGYKYYGLNGLGLSFFIFFGISFTVNYLLVKIRYQFQFSKEFIVIFLIQFTLGFAGFLSIKTLNQSWSYVLGGAVICLSLSYSLFELNKRLDILTFVKNKIRK